MWYRRSLRPAVSAAQYCLSVVPALPALVPQDHILIASPVYFEELTGVLLALLSRLQTYFSAKYIRREEPLPQKKTGGILLCAGSIGPREKAESTAAMILKLLNCENLGTVYAGKTDRIPVKEQPDILTQVKDLAKKMKNSYWSHGDQ